MRHHKPQSQNRRANHEFLKESAKVLLQKKAHFEKLKARLLKLELTNGEFELASQGKHAKLEVNKRVIDYLNLQTQINGIIYKRGEIKASIAHNRMMNGTVTVELTKEETANQEQK